MPCNRTAIVGLMVVLTAGCSSEDLSRAKAKRFIEQSEAFKSERSIVELSPQQFACGTNQGIFALQQGVGYVVTPQGRNYFRDVERWSLTNVLNAQFSERAKREILEVTGITDAPSIMGPNVKIALFTWSWNLNDFPQTIKSCFDASRPIRSEALLKLYDDGWRVERVSRQ